MIIRWLVRTPGTCVFQKIAKIHEDHPSQGLSEARRVIKVFLGIYITSRLRGRLLDAVEFIIYSDENKVWVCIPGEFTERRVFPIPLGAGSY